MASPTKNSVDAYGVNIYRAAKRFELGTAKGQTQQSAGMVKLALPHIPLKFPTKGHIMPGFCQTLIGVGALCDADCAVTFTRETVIVFNKKGSAVLTGWRESTGP